jgi:phosphoribosyl 1,2-cyclic phosphate phosphodiesterase
MKVRVLGCGTSGGVPRVDGFWGECDPANPRNRRRRVSVLVEEQGTRLLVDTSPDLREQLLDAAVTSLDAVFWTHDHADHSHGIDDLRGLYHAMGRRIPCYGDADTMAVLEQRFHYVFHGFEGYAPMASAHVLEGPVTVGPMAVQPFRLVHGPQHSIGYRIGRFAYTTDLTEIPVESEPYLDNLDLWIVDALRRTPHPTHPHLSLTLSWIERFKPKRAILTHLDWSMDYATLAKELPAGVEPGYDGLEVQL